MVRKSTVLSILFVRLGRWLPYCVFVFLVACGTLKIVDREAAVIGIPASMEDAPPTDESVLSQGVKEDALGNELLASEQAGNYSDAAQEYQRLAMEQKGEQRASYQLQEAAALLHAYQLEAASAQLLKIDAEVLTVEQSAYWHFMRAQVSRSLQQYEQALHELEGVTIDNLVLALRPKALLLRAELLFSLGRVEDMLNERWLLEPLLDGDAMTENRQQLWDSLMSMPLPLLQRLSTTLRETAFITVSLSPQNINQGWLELALLARKYSLGSASGPLSQGLQEWQLRYREHPALAAIVPALIAREQLSHRPTVVAVFLPESGALFPVAKVIRKGLLEAYYQDTGIRPTLRFYNVTADVDIVAMVWQAVDEGADIILGPLSKAQVSALHGLTGLPVPVLALNSVDGLAAWPQELYRYGLFPEDEVQQMMLEASKDGYQQALLIYPQNRWGERVANYVRTLQESEGIQLVGSVAYDEANNDFSLPIKHLIGIDKSEARKKRLARFLRKRLFFTPRKRQDADVIFMIARAEKARQIRPQLLFHYASDLPVYATSHPYQVSANRVALRDLDNTVFVDLPWNRHGSKEAWARIKGLPTQEQKYARFYVFGMDAYALLPYLHYLKRHSGEFYAGYSGRLHMDDAGKVHRNLTAWEVHRGRIRPKNRLSLYP